MPSAKTCQSSFVKDWTAQNLISVNIMRYLAPELPPKVDQVLLEHFFPQHNLSLCPFEFPPLSSKIHPLVFHTDIYGLSELSLGKIQQFLVKGVRSQKESILPLNSVRTSDIPTQLWIEVVENHPQLLSASILPTELSQHPPQKFIVSLNLMHFFKAVILEALEFIGVYKDLNLANQKS